jgi:hypothetical protein
MEGSTSPSNLIQTACFLACLRAAVSVAVVAVPESAFGAMASVGVVAAVVSAGVTAVVSANPNAVANIKIERILEKIFISIMYKKVPQKGNFYSK